MQVSALASSARAPREVARAASTNKRADAILDEILDRIHGPRPYRSSQQAATGVIVPTAVTPRLPHLPSRKFSSDKAAEKAKALAAPNSSTSANQQSGLGQQSQAQPLGPAAPKQRSSGRLAAPTEVVPKQPTKPLSAVANHDHSLRSTSAAGQQLPQPRGFSMTPLTVPSTPSPRFQGFGTSPAAATSPEPPPEIRIFLYGVDQASTQAAIDQCGWKGRVGIVTDLKQAAAVVTAKLNRTGKVHNAMAQAQAAAQHQGIPFVCVGRQMSKATLQRSLLPLLTPSRASQREAISHDENAQLMSAGEAIGS